MKQFCLHFAIWLMVYGLWITASRNHHPTVLLNLLATAVLIAVSAATVYVNRFILWPRFQQRRVWWRYCLELIGLVLMLDVIAVVTFQMLYDRLWGPDPLRYGIMTNLIYEAVFIGFHLAVGTAVLIVIHRQVRKKNRETVNL